MIKEGATQQLTQPETQFNLLDVERPEALFLKSSNANLNSFLGGGLHKGMITQVYGESGSGKTQLAMLFMLGAISRNMIAAYLSTQKELSWQRFTSLAYTYMNESEYQEKQANLIYKKSSDFALGYEFIEETLKKIKDSGKGGVLIIDSIHGLLNSCFQYHHIENDSFSKSRNQAQLVNRIRWLSKMSGTAVLLINHAADAIDKRRNSNNRNIIAALGPSWELNLDQSIFLNKKGQIRQIIVNYSPKCKANSKSRFRIQAEGFTWISDDGVQY